MSKAKKFRNWAIILFLLAFIGIILKSLKFGNFMNFISSSSGYPFAYGGLVSILLDPFIWVGTCLLLKAKEIEKSFQKPSIDIKMFGTYIILSSLNGLILLLFKLNNWKETGLPDFGVLNDVLLVLPIVTVILGMNILRLKEWARKGVIIFSGLIMISPPIIFYVLFVNHKIQGLTSDEVRAFPVSLFLVLLMSVIVGAPQMYFFTRSSVKEQFK